MTIWFRAMGILCGVAAYYLYTNDDELVGMVLGAVAVFAIGMSWIFKGVS